MIYTVLVLGLAGFSITHMLQETNGPGDLFLRVRLWIGTQLPILNDDGAVIGYIPDIEPHGFISKLYSCYECLSVWVCLLLLFLYILSANDRVSIASYVLIWMSSVGVAYLANSVYHREE